MSLTAPSRAARISSLKITCCISCFMHVLAHSTANSCVSYSQRRPFAGTLPSAMALSGRFLDALGVSESPASLQNYFRCLAEHF